MIKKWVRRVKNKWQYELNRQFKPEIIGNIKMHNGKLLKYTRISNTTHISNWPNIELEDHVFIGHFNYIDGFRKVRIGRGCQVTNFVSILTHSSHDAIRLYGEHYIQVTDLKALKNGPVSIGEFSYIGAHAVIMPGSKLGKGCIVSAFSYVDGEFPDYSILRGSPAQLIGSTKDRDQKWLQEFPELKSFYYDPITEAK